jgi:phosphatidate phosphatase APP1
MAVWCGFEVDLFELKTTDANGTEKTSFAKGERVYLRGRFDIITAAAHVGLSGKFPEVTVTDSNGSNFYGTTQTGSDGRFAYSFLLTDAMATGSMTVLVDFKGEGNCTGSTSASFDVGGAGAESVATGVSAILLLAGALWLAKSHR